MLVLTRKPGQSVRIKPAAFLDPETPVKELFGGGAIEIVVTQISGPQVKLAILADPRLVILRDELCK